MIPIPDNEQYPEYVPPGATTTTPSSWATTVSFQVSLGIVTTFQHDEERTLTGSLFGAASSSEEASGSKSGSAFGSAYLLGQIQTLPLAPSFRETWGQKTTTIKTRVIRLIAQSLHPHPEQINSPPWPRNPTGGVSMGSTKYTGIPRWLNERALKTWLVTVKHRVVTGSLHTILEVHKLFTRYNLEWMDRGLGTYSVEIVREFYASYVAILWGSLSRRARPAKTGLTHFCVSLGIQGRNLPSHYPLMFVCPYSWDIVGLHDSRIRLLVEYSQKWYI